MYKYFKRILFIAVVFVFLMIFLAGWLYFKGYFGSHILYHHSSFKKLPHWDNDDHLQAFVAFQVSCQAIMKQKPKQLFLTNLPISQSAIKWQQICLAAKKIQPADPKSAKAFFEQWFVPYHVTNNYNPATLFTGYYVPLIKASLKSNGYYTVPIYGLPNDLLRIKISLFSPSYKSKKSLIGRLQGNVVLPYYDRKAIMNGAISHSAPVILWGNSLIDIFFAQIQGSAFVQLPDGKLVLIGYAGDNGRPYTPIGKFLIKQKIIDRKNISMDSIKNWLVKNPDKVMTVLNQDASYVFFKIMPDHNPIGSEGVPLTAGRSLAVDTSYLPLGAPIFIAHLKVANQTLNRLLIAQDTGGAIKGMHGDIFWGIGEQAGRIAGPLKGNGKWWVLFPR